MSKEYKAASALGMADDSTEREREQRRAASKRRYAADPERYRQQAKTWRQRNPEKVKDIAKRWREANPDNHRLNNKRWYQNNKEKNREKARLYRLAHPDKVKEYNRITYQRHREKRREQNLLWRLANADKIKAKRATNYAENRDQIIAHDLARRKADPITILLRSAKIRAKRYGLEFTITKADISIPAVCPILGIPLVFGAGNGKAQAGSVTIDRINNALGYIPENIQIISWRANALKRDATPAELIALGEYAKRWSAIIL